MQLPKTCRAVNVRPGWGNLISRRCWTVAAHREVGQIWPGWRVLGTVWKGIRCPYSFINFEVVGLSKRVCVGLLLALPLVYQDRALAHGVYSQHDEEGQVFLPCDLNNSLTEVVDLLWGEPQMSGQ